MRESTSSLNEPALSALFLFTVTSEDAGEPGPFCQPWEKQNGLALTMEVDQPDSRYYRGQTKAGTPCQLAWGLAHDTHLVRLTLSLAGDHPPTAWVELRLSLEELIDRTFRGSSAPTPWAVTYLYHALVGEDAQTDDVRTLLTDPDGLGLSRESTDGCNLTPFGWMWKLDEERNGQDDTNWLQRTLVLLVPRDRAQVVRSRFLDPLTQGLVRIELYLHKGNHHAAQHDIIRVTLQRTGADLQDRMLTVLRRADVSQLDREKLELEEVARRLMSFLIQKTQAEVLLNSLRSNLHALNDHLERVTLDTPLYNQQVARLERQIEQLQSDLRNAGVVSQSTYTFQDVQRGMQAARVERASLVMGGAAAVFTAFAVFNSFLEILGLSAGDSHLALSQTWPQVALVAMATLGVALGVYWFVVQYRVRAVVALSLSALALAMAVISTPWVN